MAAISANKKMIATERISIAQNLTPPLRPIAAVLRDAAIATHCSACFSAFSLCLRPEQNPIAPHKPIETDYEVPEGSPTLLYCSHFCLNHDDEIHHSSFEHAFMSEITDLHESADFRLSLRLATLLRRFPINTSSERILGLLTNSREMADDSRNYLSADEFQKSREALIETGRRMGMDCSAIEDIQFALCLAMTNSVEVIDKDGNGIGIAVYDHNFSWINHSCSPNSSYRFLMGVEGDDDQNQMKIAPGIDDAEQDVYEQERFYGPKVVVRSLRSITEGEEITIPYTDLLQTKEMRRAKLWSKYRFYCSCMRCGADYIDCALEARNAPKNEILEIMHKLDLVSSKPKADLRSFSHKLEEFLCPNSKSEPYPFSYVSIKACSALAAAYEARGKGLEADVVQQDATYMYKQAAAYYLLLAGIGNYFLNIDSSLILAAERSWRTTGAALLRFWNAAYCKDELDFILIPDTLKLTCPDCPFLEDLNPDTDQFQVRFEELKNQLHSCLAKIAAQVWSDIAPESTFTKSIQNPVDFTPGNSYRVDSEARSKKKNVLMLGLHCLRYGALLSSVCNGKSVNKNYESCKCVHLC